MIETAVTQISLLVDQLPRLTSDLAWYVLDVWWVIIGAAVVIDVVVTIPLYVLWKKGKETEEERQGDDG